jgi:hypothetical protein
MRRITLVLLVSLCGCGYQFGSPYILHAVDVPIFQNNTQWRLNEFTLTEVVIRELQAQGIKVNSGSQLELVGEIVDYTKPGIVEGLDDRLIVGSVHVRINIKLRQKKDGRIILEDTCAESATVIGARGETEDTARQEVFHRLARWVASRLQKE